MNRFRRVRHKVWVTLWRMKAGGKAFLHLFVVLYRYRNSGHLKEMIKYLVNTTAIQVVRNFKNFEGDAFNIAGQNQLENPKVSKTRDRIFGLHSLLPPDDRYSYSILIPVYKPNPDFFRTAVRSALNQTAPKLEVILGLDGEQSQDVLEVIEELRRDPQYAAKLKVISVDRSNGGGISRTTNAIAQHAKGYFLVLMDHDDWIRPDLLYRYELCLRLHKNIEKLVLFCNEYKINEKNMELPGTALFKEDHPPFPYIFVNYICHCLMVPKGLWNRVGGLRPECDGSQDFDLCLRMDLEGAQFQNVPFLLYAWRMHNQSTAKIIDSKDYATPAGIRAFKDYVSKKGLSWKIQEGNYPTSYRAIPPDKPGYPVHVIIPYHDQKELTFKSVKSVLKQLGVKTLITAVDNRSKDKTIASDLVEMGVEVLCLDEPFNYSRINNYAIKNSRYSSDTDAILFLNNDVELESDALAEMVRWIDQPKIGMVGAKLLYPDGRVQHGGVILNLKDGPAYQMMWSHIGGGLPESAGGFHQVINICDAVTAACLLMKREIFEKIKGFDEVWYPIAFSDTDLALRVKKLGLYPLYTPFAKGVHHESASRGPGVWEEPEASYWQFRNTEFRDSPKERLEHPVFFR